MRKIIYFNKANLELLDRLDEEKLNDFSGYVCNLIREDLRNEEMQTIASDLKEIKQKLDDLQEILINPQTSLPYKEEDVPLDIDNLLWN